MTQVDVERAIAEVWALFKETRVQMAETDKRIAETSRLIAEGAKKSEATDRKLERLIGKWGIFVENVIAPGIPRVFQERNIEITHVSNRKQEQGKEEWTANGNRRLLEKQINSPIEMAFSSSVNLVNLVTWPFVSMTRILSPRNGEAMARKVRKV